jgi:hypothetical protein
MSASLHASAATFTFTVGGTDYDAVRRAAKERADAYWGRTAYKVTLIRASASKATVTTQALQAVAA